MSHVFPWGLTIFCSCVSASFWNEKFEIKLLLGREKIKGPFLEGRLFYL